MLLRLLPNGPRREAGEVSQVGCPRARQEFRSLRLDIWIDPSVPVAARLVVSMRNTDIVGEGKPEDRKDQFSGGCREVSVHLSRSSQKLRELS